MLKLFLILMTLQAYHNNIIMYHLKFINDHLWTPIKSSPGKGSVYLLDINLAKIITFSKLSGYIQVRHYVTLAFDSTAITNFLKSSASS